MQRGLVGSEMCIRDRFNHQNFAKNAKKIIVDIDSNEIRKLDMDFSLSINTSADVFLDAMLDVSKDFSGNFSTWMKHAKELYLKYPVILPEYAQGNGRVNTYHLLDVLSEVLTGDDLIVPGSSGACAELTQQAFKITSGQRIQNTPGLGAMGFGLPAVIGACIASGRRRTIGITGDGGIQMNIQELETIKRLGLPVKMFVLNNDGYGSIYGMQKNRFDNNFVACGPSSGLTLPDMCKLASAYGLASVRIENQKDLKNKIEEVLNLPGPVICDVLVDLDVPSAPRLSSEMLPDGRIVSKPMEDLFPFLPREEYNEIMSWNGEQLYVGCCKHNCPCIQCRKVSSGLY
eukprot:TRINITY_DN8788_c0_g1_i1.p1 TRINITY_DN8788_c0_g1~~TRINITY_DN8788_c0_g1_i1.p1  ORF type:complete len:345 (-),score=68.30 TRINITY_DN8788_c0_g1_i1:995-2029(-)